MKSETPLEEDLEEWTVLLAERLLFEIVEEPLTPERVVLVGAVRGIQENV